MVPLHPQNEKFALPPILRRFGWALMLLYLLCWGVEWCCRQLPAFNHEPYNYPFLMEHYPDLLSFTSRFAVFHSPSFFSFPSPNLFMYPAPVAVAYKAFYLMPIKPLAAFLGLILLSFLVACLLFGRVLRGRGIAMSKAYSLPLLVVVCSYPVWFEFKQANMEILVWLLVTGGVVLFLWGRGYSAAICFGVAAAMKLYPIIYLGLLLSRKQYRPILVGVIVSVVVTVMSLWLVDPMVSSSWHEVSKGLDNFRVIYMLHRRPELGFDHSLFALSKMVPGPYPPAEKMAPYLSAYLAATAAGGTALYFIRIRKLPVLNQVLALTVASILFPPVSFEYTLMHLFLPLSMLTLLVIDLARQNIDFPEIKVCFVCLALLLGTIPELIVHHHRVGGQLKALLLVCLLYIAVRYPLGSTPRAEADGDISRIVNDTREASA